MMMIMMMMLMNCVIFFQCFDAGWCECGAAPITSTTAANYPAVTTPMTGLSLASNLLIAPYVYQLLATGTES